MTRIKNVCVIGSGIMGHGIAEVCAIAGYNVILVDVSNATKLTNRKFKRVLSFCLSVC